MLYTIQAQVSGKNADGWDFSRQVPTFTLDSAVQGITSAEHAEKVARDLILSVAKDVTVNLIVTPVPQPHIVVHKTVYGPWPTDDDGDPVDGEREVIRRESSYISCHGDEFDSPVNEAIKYLTHEGYGTEGIEYSEGAWLTETYEDPYEDKVTERHAFLTDFSESAAGYIWAELS